MVTEYAPGAGIGWHRDRPTFENIAAVSFLAPCVLRLRRKVGEDWERRFARIEPRSVYLLSGTSRLTCAASPNGGLRRHTASSRAFDARLRRAMDARNALMAPNPSFGLARFGKAAYALVRGDVISSSCHLQETTLEGGTDGFETN